MGLKIRKAKAKVKKSKGKSKPASGSKKKKADADKVGLSLGKTTGMGVTEFWNKLLGANERKKLTDAKLVKAFKEEFPRRELVQPVGRVRSFYNRNTLGFGDNSGKTRRGTPRQSFAYDKHGEITIYTDWGFDRPKNPANVKAGALRAAKRWGKKPVKKKGLKIKKVKGKKKAA